MFWIALLIALVLTAVFVWGFSMRKGAWGSGLAFFAIVFLSSWAAGSWVRPINAALPSNAPWLTQFIVGFVTALLMSSSMPAWNRKVRTSTAVPGERRSPPVSALTPAYWVALVVLLVAVIVR